MRPAMRKIAVTLVSVGMMLSACIQLAEAGDRTEVMRALQSIQSNWSEAQFSVDLLGPLSGEAIVGTPIKLQYEATRPGYPAYIKVSSHGDISLVRDASTTPR